MKYVRRSGAFRDRCLSPVGCLDDPPLCVDEKWRSGGVAALAHTESLLKEKRATQPLHTPTTRIPLFLIGVSRVAARSLFQPPSHSNPQRIPDRVCGCHVDPVAVRTECQAHLPFLWRIRLYRPMADAVTTRGPSLRSCRWGWWFHAVWGFALPLTHSRLVAPQCRVDSSTYRSPDDLSPT